MEPARRGAGAHGASAARPDALGNPSPLASWGRGTLMHGASGSSYPHLVDLTIWTQAERWKGISTT